MTMAFRTVRPFPADCDPFAPLFFVLHKQRKAEARRARRFRLAACTLFLVLVGILAGFVLTEPAHAFSAERLHKIINGRMLHAEQQTAPAQSGFGFDMTLSRGNSATWADPNSTSAVDYRLSYTIPLDGSWGASERACERDGADYARQAVMAVSWALSNRLVRGNSDFTLPGGPTLHGHAIKWAVTAMLYPNFSAGQAIRHAAADIASEQLAGWSGELDIGYSAELPSNHWAYNPGSKTDDTAGMIGHMYRANVITMAMLREEYGAIDPALMAAPAIGGAGYLAGRELGDAGVTAGWETDTMRNKLGGSRPYIAGELTQGFAMGIGVARSIDCH